MSLKSKIEAVIYAAEEPVTLTQLVAIFAGEVPLPETSLVDQEPSPEQLHAPLSEPEILTLDASGTMSELPPPEPAEASESSDLGAAPLLAEEPDGESAAATSEFALAAATRRAEKQREREIRDFLRTLVDELIADYVVLDRGIEIREIAGGFRMATKPEYHDAVRAFVKSLKPPMKLSLQALETLAVIAYKQPVTAPEVAEIRGVDSGGVLASLISRKLVTTAGRKQVIGRPILYKTTKEFLMRFGLKDIAELPSMEEFEKMAVELAESDALEASAMHDKAGIHLVSDDPSDDDTSLPFEQDAPHTADPADEPPSSAVRDAADQPSHETVPEPIAATEEVPQEQES